MTCRQPWNLVPFLMGHLFHHRQERPKEGSRRTILFQEQHKQGEAPESDRSQPTTRRMLICFRFVSALQRGLLHHRPGAQTFQHGPSNNRHHRRVHRAGRTASNTRRSHRCQATEHLRLLDRGVRRRLDLTAPLLPLALMHMLQLHRGSMRSRRKAITRRLPRSRHLGSPSLPAHGSTEVGVEAADLRDSVVDSGAEVGV